MSFLRWLSRLRAMPDVSAEAVGHGARAGVVVKIQTPQLEINIRIPNGEAARLDTVRRADWDSRGSLRIGDVAGAPAWWCVDTQSRTFSVLVGDDDESWDIAVTLPLGSLDAVIAAVARARRER